jgi:hypothetical protein
LDGSGRGTWGYLPKGENDVTGKREIVFQIRTAKATYSFTKTKTKNFDQQSDIPQQPRIHVSFRNYMVKSISGW